jgi:class 3 adenylate cyclase
MSCVCGQSRPEGAKFCPECGAAFAPRCGSCGAELTPAAKFCAECGVATKGVEKPSPELSAPNLSARKVVTILFADLAGSTALHERLDPESVNAFMERYYAAMRGAAEAHGGTVVKFLGDGVMVAFGVPRVAEDDAMRAVRAGVAMQLAFGDLAGIVGRALSGPPRGTHPSEIGLRVALNTGEVVVNADNSDVVGDPVNVAARLQQEAGNGDVVLGESTQRLVSALVTLAPLGKVTLKGRAEAVKAYRVESLERPAGVIAAPFVGRTAELASLEAAYATAVEKPATGLAVLLGSPGLGKSRLIGELKRRLGDTTTVITAYCDAAGGATFAPVAAALREVLPALPAAEGGEAAASGDPLRLALEAVVPEGAERARIVAGIAALLAGSPASPEETFFVVRRMLAALAQVKPVVLVIDDLHWAEPLLLDLVERRRRVAVARRARSRRPPRSAAAQRADRARQWLVPRRARAALPPRPRSRRRLPPPPQGHSRRAARALRRLGRGACRRRGPRRDHRLASRAGGRGHGRFATRRWRTARAPSPPRRRCAPGVSSPRCSGRGSPAAPRRRAVGRESSCGPLRAGSPWLPGPRRGGERSRAPAAASARGVRAAAAGGLRR